MSIILKMFGWNKFNELFNFLLNYLLLFIGGTNSAHIYDSNSVSSVKYISNRYLVNCNILLPRDYNSTISIIR